MTREDFLALAPYEKELDKAVKCEPVHLLAKDANILASVYTSMYRRVVTATERNCSCFTNAIVRPLGLAYFEEKGRGTYSAPVIEEPTPAPAVEEPTPAPAAKRTRKAKK